MVHRLRTIFKLTAGFALLIAGGVLALPGVPGPGFVLILLGLVLLADHFVWAKNALAWARKRVDQLRRTGGNPPNQPEDAGSRASKGVED
jgi:hypothetical protein